jgi:hypothetical protein
MIIKNQKMVFSHLPDTSLAIFVNIAKLSTEINKDDE